MSSPSSPPQTTAKSTTPQPSTPAYNPLSRGYAFLALTSLINLSSISNVPKNGDFYVGNWGMNISFPVVTFALSLAVLILDRTPKFRFQIHINKNNNNNNGTLLEGTLFLVLTLWWIVGVGYSTQVDGIAYRVLNIYVSSWASLVACVYLLNQWSTRRDLLSIAELTGVSVTLKSWYVLWLASLVVAGSCVNSYIHQGEYGRLVGQDDAIDPSAALMGIILGFASAALAFWFLLTHYRLAECFDYGGCTELVAALVLIVVWICGVSILTQEGALGATIVGRHDCPVNTAWEQVEFVTGATGTRDDQENYNDFVEQFPTVDCHALVYFDHVDANGTQVRLAVNTTLPCALMWGTPPALAPDSSSSSSQVDTAAVPGSNVYVFVWICLAASIHIALRWKAQQAVQFAARAQRKQSQQDGGATSNDLEADFPQDEEEDLDDDDDDNLDEFVDSVPE